MKLTAYRLTVLVLTNALTGLIAFAFGGAYATRIMDKKNKPDAKATNGSRPSGPPDFGAMLRDDIRKRES